MFKTLTKQYYHTSTSKKEIWAIIDLNSISVWKKKSHETRGSSIKIWYLSIAQNNLCLFAMGKQKIINEFAIVCLLYFRRDIFVFILKLSILLVWKREVFILINKVYNIDKKVWVLLSEHTEWHVWFHAVLLIQFNIRILLIIPKRTPTSFRTFNILVLKCLMCDSN